MNASQLWGNSFLAKRAARGLVKIGIGVPVTVGDMDAAVEPIGIYLRRVTEMTVLNHYIISRLEKFLDL